MKEIQLLTFDLVTRGDTYEIAYAHSYPASHWSKDSLYLVDDEIGIHIIAPALDQVFPKYAYYGPQKITIHEWSEVERICKAANTGNPSIFTFFKTVDEWLANGNRGADYFWILGI